MPKRGRGAWKGEEGEVGAKGMQWRAPNLCVYGLDILRGLWNGALWRADMRPLVFCVHADDEDDEVVGLLNTAPGSHNTHSLGRVVLIDKIAIYMEGVLLLSSF